MPPLPSRPPPGWVPVEEEGVAPQRAVTSTSPGLSLVAAAALQPVVAMEGVAERSPTPDPADPVTAAALPMVKEHERVQIGMYHEDVGAAGLRFDAAMHQIVDSTNLIKEQAADLMPSA